MFRDFGTVRRVHRRSSMLVEASFNKATGEILAAAMHKAQVVTYLRLTGCPAELLINFNVARLMDGVTRLVNPRGSYRR
jgi:PD-(D/E)XK nuclease superfamily protein